MKSSRLLVGFLKVVPRPSGSPWEVVKMQMDPLGWPAPGWGVFKPFKLEKQVTGPFISLPRAGVGVCVPVLC